MKKTCQRPECDKLAAYHTRVWTRDFVEHYLAVCEDCFRPYIFANEHFGIWWNNIAVEEYEFEK